MSIHDKINAKKLFNPMRMFDNAKDIKSYYKNHFYGIV